MEAKLDKYGRVYLPKELREKLGLTTGTVLHFVVRGHTLLLTWHPQSEAPAPPLRSDRARPSPLSWQRLEALS